ncbi:MAG: histidinol-phosphate transaminase [Opitutaceae bacterium]|nr:histidinol-phosphate transaminase [Opitutaceae bacterium]
MNIEELANPSVLTQPVYEPGKPIEDVARELGLDPEGIVKLASNENPFGASPLAVKAAKKALKGVALYPDGGCVRLRAKLGAFHGVEPRQVVVGAGSNELLELLGHVFLRPGDEALMSECSFAVYKLVALLFGARPVEVPMVNFTHDLAAMAAAVTERTRLVFVCTPNNPTGTFNTEEEVLAFARGLPGHVVLVLDEAYGEFLEKRPDFLQLVREGRNVICLKTFSKIHGLAGLRVGYGIAGAGLAGLLNRVRQPFNVNAVAQAAAAAALDDRKFVEKCARKNRRGLAQLRRGFRKLKVESVPSAGNFILAKVGDGARVFAELQGRGVIVRPMGGYKLPEWVRVTVGTPSQNKRLLRELEAVLSGMAG